MTVRTTGDTAQILRRIRAALRADPVRNTVLSSVAAVLAARGGGAWSAYNRVALAARAAPEQPVALTAGWRDVDALAAALATLPSIAQLGGPAETVEAVVERLGHEPVRRIAERLYRLDTLVPPAGVAGGVRRAGESDIELVTSWVEPYTVETFGALPPGFSPRRQAEAAIRSSQTWLWLAPDGTPVALAARRPAAAGVSRIGPVYTLPAERGHGYGSAVTAHAARGILDEGAIPVLYADLANRTSNKIYQAIGFRPVADRLSVSFEPAPAPDRATPRTRRT